MTESNDLNRSESDVSTQVTPTFVTDSAQERMSGPTRRSTKGGWTPEQDKLLIDAVRTYKEKNWKKIGPWRKEEDDLLSDLVNIFIENDKPKWSKISKQLPGRIGKQCRERWHNHLKPNIKKTLWTREEELVLIQTQREHGNKWAEIAKLLPGRTENNIKNHWNCSLKRRLEQLPSSLSSGSGPSGSESSSLVIQGNLIPQRDSLELTLGSMNTPPSTCSLIGEEKTIPQTPQSSNEVKGIRERLRMAASTFKNTPSIISKRSSPASVLKRRIQENDSPFQASPPSHLPSEEEHSVSNSPSSSSILLKRRNTCSGSEPLERRLEFDFI